MSKNNLSRPARAAVVSPVCVYGAPAPVGPSENPAEFLAVLAGFRREFRPSTIVEQTQVYQLAATAWRIRRLPFYETHAISSFVSKDAAVRKLEAVSRHEVRLLRSFYDLLAGLRSSAGAAAFLPERLDRSPRAPSPVVH